MATNDFLPFANGGGANVLTQAQYAALTALLSGGYQSGVANSAQMNKTWRQSSIMAAVLGQFAADYSGNNSVDDGTIATLEANLVAAIRSATKTGVILADTGATNAYTAVNSPPLVAGAWVDGVVQQVKIAHANTGASTYAPDGLTAIPIYGLGLQPLQGGELALNGTAVLMRLTIAGVNSGNPIAVLMECAGGAQQVAPATQSQHAVQMGQVGHGQCQLQVQNSTTLALVPFNGNNLIINGVPRQVPTGGVAISNSGLSASTLYYIYAQWTAGAMSIIASTTSHLTSSTGIETMIGDATKSYVGMIYTAASSQFVDSGAQRFIRSWFNKQMKMFNTGSQSNSTTSTTNVQLSTTNIQFVAEIGDAIDGGFDGFANSTAAGGYGVATAYVNGVANGTPSQFYSAVTNANGKIASWVAGTVVTAGLQVIALYASSGNGSSCVFNFTGVGRTFG